MAEKKRKLTGINKFAVEVASIEGGKVNLSIAQIKEVLKCVNIKLDGQLYKIIRARA